MPRRPESSIGAVDVEKFLAQAATPSSVPSVRFLFVGHRIRLL